MRSSKLVILFFLIVSFSTYSCAKRDPKIEFEAIHFDLGNIGKTDRIKILYADFLNKGGGQLHISEIRTDCDCTTTEFPRKNYAKGEGGKIKIRVDLTGSWPGKVKKSVAVYTNSKTSPTLITIEGYIPGS